MSGFSDFGVGGGSDNSLPIKLLDFTASCNGDEAVIKWTTSSEENNNYFSIEKSKDMNNWYLVNTVQGAGTTNFTQKYNISDLSPFSGLSYYRLTQVDYNGNAEAFSPVASECLENESNTFEIINFSLNETKDVLTITYNSPQDGNVTISLVNDIGQSLVGKKYSSVKGLNAISLHRKLSIGIYLMSIEVNNNVYTQKIYVH